MSQLILATGANRTYMERITPYLHTIAEHGASFDRRVFITVGCQVEMPPELDRIGAVPLPAARVLGHTGIWCVQQGCFLEVLDAADDDVIVFTDGDMRMQRPPTAWELVLLRAMPADTLALGWNAGPGDTLAHEAQRLGLSEAGHALYADYLPRTVYNFGVVVTRAATYRALYQRYLERWDEYRVHTTHYAATQFLLCVCLYDLGLQVWELPMSFHAHGIFGAPAAGLVEGEDGTLLSGGELALFRHHWKC